jgi:hypothetical protein
VSNLVERQEIGQAIIDDILLDLLNYVYRECASLQTTTTSGFKKSLLGAYGYGVAHAAQQQQTSKELNEIKKATCNFLFQSFQLYFIWEFCATKFEVICQNYTTRSPPQQQQQQAGVNAGAIDGITPITDNNGQQQQQQQYQYVSASEMNMMNVSPAQLCDLYEFILDLLTNSVRNFVVV